MKSLPLILLSTTAAITSTCASSPSTSHQSSKRFEHRLRKEPGSYKRQETANSGAKFGRRFITNDPTVLEEDPTFTHIILGGGQSGLVVASRLLNSTSSYDTPPLRILVIEAGEDWALNGGGNSVDGGNTGEGEGGGEPEGPDQGWTDAGVNEQMGVTVKERIEIPAMAWYGGLANPDSPYDWHYETIPQVGLEDRTIYFPRGKLLGGSSAVNGLYLVRGSVEEHDGWESLIRGADPELDADPELNWDFEGFQPWNLKSERYTPPLKENAEKGGIVWDWNNHGRDGPVHYSYPSYFFPQISTWIKTFFNLGVETRDPAGGQGYGCFVSTSALDPEKHRRSYSRNSYLDPLIAEGSVNQNELIVLAGYHASKIHFEQGATGMKATGVHFRKEGDDSSDWQALLKDPVAGYQGQVILSGGVVGTPHMLQLSGVGPKELLEKVGVDVKVDLPGVGSHLQDHLSSQITYSTTVEDTGDKIKSNPEFAMQQMELWRSGSGGSMYEAPNDAIAYINTTTLFEAASEEFLTGLQVNMTSAVSSLTVYSETVRKGYEATYKSEAETIMPSEVGQIEILMSNTGRGSGGDPTISIQVAIQHPFSRGSVQLKSTNPFENPLVDPGYLTHPADIQVLRAGFRYARKVASTPPLSDLLLNEVRPGPHVQTDEQWDHFIRHSVSTEFHPAGTSSMLPLDMGGVVGKNLKVYGLENVRVIDASIVPVGFSAHLMAPTYGIAEKGAHIVLRDLERFWQKVKGSTEHIDDTQSTTEAELDSSDTEQHSAEFDPEINSEVIENSKAEGALGKLSDLLVQVADYLGIFWFASIA